MSVPSCREMAPRAFTTPRLQQVGLRSLPQSSGRHVWLRGYLVHTEGSLFKKPRDKGKRYTRDNKFPAHRVFRLWRTSSFRVDATLNTRVPRSTTLPPARKTPHTSIENQLRAPKVSDFSNLKSGVGISGTSPPGRSSVPAKGGYRLR